MRILTLLLMSVFAGCHTTTPATSLPLPPAAPTAPAPLEVAPPAPAATAALEQKLRQQTQVIEALISQNEALATRLAQAGGTAAPALGASAAPPAGGAILPPVSSPPVSPPTPPGAGEPMLTPNADGVIDLAAASTPTTGAPVNPFTVRTQPGDGSREVTLRIGGVVAGPTPCAVINDRLLQSGDVIESLAIEHIEPDAVVLRRDGLRMRLRVSDQAVHLRMPL
jgi:hypothetical protein